MALACISIGSNLNKPREQVTRAIDLLSSIPLTSVLSCSNLYETEPWGAGIGEGEEIKDQPNFINAIAGLQTELEPLELLDELQNIENIQGRIRDKKWGPRVLDLDIICYDQLSLNHPRLKLPHPYFSERSFVLEPLFELYPELQIAGKTVFQWRKNLQEKES